MADMSKINFNIDGVNNEFDIKDKVARNTLGTQVTKNILKLGIINPINGLTVTVNPDKSITINGTSTNYKAIFLMTGLKLSLDKRYTISLSDTSTGMFMFIGVADQESTYQHTDTTATITPKVEINGVWLYCEIGTTFNNVTLYPMIRSADITDSTYEPYKPSIDTRLTQAENDILKHYGTLSTISKNLINPSKITSQYVLEDGSLQADSTGSLSDFIRIDGKPFVVTCAKKTGGDSIRVNIYDEDKNFIKRIAPYETEEVKVNDSSIAFVRVNINNSKHDLSTLQLEFGTVATPYEPYKPSIDTRLTDVENNKMGYEYGRGYAKDDNNIGWFKIASFSCPAMGSEIRRAMFFVTGVGTTYTGVLSVSISSVSGNTPGISGIGCSWAYNQLKKSNEKYETGIPIDSFKAIANLNGNLINVELWGVIRSTYHVLKVRLLSFENRKDFLPINNVQLYLSDTSTTEEPEGDESVTSTYELRTELNNLTDRIATLEAAVNTLTSSASE